MWPQLPTADGGEGGGGGGGGGEEQIPTAFHHHLYSCQQPRAPPHVTVPLIAPLHSWRMSPDQRDVSRNSLDVWEPHRQVSVEPYVFESLFIVVSILLLIPVDVSVRVLISDGS